MELDLREMYLGEEVDASIRLIEKGLAELQAVDLGDDFFYPPMLLLSTGLERLMKCILCLRTQVTTGELPTWKTIKDYGHDLERLRDEVVAECFDGEYRRSRQAADADAAFLESDVHLRSLLTALSRFALSARYHNLNVVGGAQPQTDDPGG